MSKGFTPRAIRALDLLHCARFRCGRVPTGNDGVYVHDAYDICKALGCPVDIDAFTAHGLLLNAIAEAVRVGVLVVVEASP